MDFSNQSHPIWAFGRFVALLIAATVIFYTNAQKFDANEIRMLLELAAAAGGVEVGKRLLVNRKPAPTEESEPDQSQ